MTALTHLELVWVKDRIENRIRFGPIAEQHVLDRSRQLVSFEPGSIFAFVQWASSNDSGTIFSQIDILRAVMEGERMRPSLVFGPVARFCCVSLAGGRL